MIAAPPSTLVRRALVTLDAQAARAADRLIRLYQRWLSPLKGPGHGCAHRVLHGGASCSQHVHELLREAGLCRALPAAIMRFDACRTAAERLNPPRGRSGSGHRHRRGQCCIVLPLPVCTTTRTGRLP